MLKLVSVALISFFLIGCEGLPRRFAGKYQLSAGHCLHDQTFDQIFIEMSDEIKATKVTFNDSVRNYSFVVVYDDAIWNSFHESCNGILCTQRSVKYENQTLTDSSQKLIRIINESTGSKVEQIIVPWTVDIHAMFESDKVTVDGLITGGKTCEYIRR